MTEHKLMKVWKTARKLHRDRTQLQVLAQKSSLNPELQKENNAEIELLNKSIQKGQNLLISYGYNPNVIVAQARAATKAKVKKIIKRKSDMSGFRPRSGGVGTFRQSNRVKYWKN